MLSPHEVFLGSPWEFSFLFTWCHEQRELFLCCFPFKPSLSDVGWKKNSSVVTGRDKWSVNPGWTCPAVFTSSARIWFFTNQEICRPVWSYEQTKRMILCHRQKPAQNWEQGDMRELLIQWLHKVWAKFPFEMHSAVGSRIYLPENKHKRSVVLTPW